MNPSSVRPIRAVVRGHVLNMGGMSVRQPLPVGDLNGIDPFLLLHHAGPIRFSGGGRQQDAGVPPHPHRGFDPVTFVYKGGVHHRDSLGNDSIIGAGGVQWTTTGRGLIHSERPPRGLVEEGGEQEIIQLWVNVPRAHRMGDPRYQGIPAESIPTAQTPDDLVEVSVVAGTFEGVTGPAETLSPITALNVVLREGGARFFALPTGHNALLYLLDGRVRLNDEREVEGLHLVHLGREGEGVHLEAVADTRLLLLTGEPIGEPYVTSGPFVVDSKLDIYHAMQDYQEGRMGSLVELF